MFPSLPTFTASLLTLTAFAALAPSRSSAQVVEWAAITSGRMLDIYDPDRSEEHLLAAGLTMARLSLTVYRNDPVDHAMEARGTHFRVERFIRAGRGSQALILRDHRVAVVAVRGTDERVDQVISARIYSSPRSTFRGAHAGFALAAEALVDELTPLLEGLRGDGVEQVWFTGHSLGGAVAQLLALHFHRGHVPIGRVMVFGAPAPGQSEWREHYAPLASRTHRFQNDGDLIACLPPDAKWRQSGHLHQLEDGGAVLYASGDHCGAALPASAYGSPICDLPPAARRVLSFFAPLTLIECSIPYVDRELHALLTQLLLGNGTTLHKADVYIERLATEIPHLVRPLTGL